MLTNPDQATMRLVDLCREYLRPPASYASDDGVPELAFIPPLTAPEQTTFDLLAAIARSGLDLSPAEYGPVRTELAAIRDLRQLGRNAFLALTAAERDRRLYDAQTSTTIILLAVLRD